MDDLRECPFCNDPMKVNNAGTFKHVDGDDCILGQLAWAETPRFIAAWNRRAPDPARQRGR